MYVQVKVKRNKWNVGRGFVCVSLMVSLVGLSVRLHKNTETKPTILMTFSSNVCLCLIEPEKSSWCHVIADMSWLQMNNFQHFQKPKVKNTFLAIFFRVNWHREIQLVSFCPTHWRPRWWCCSYIHICYHKLIWNFKKTGWAFGISVICKD